MHTLCFNTQSRTHLSTANESKIKREREKKKNRKRKRNNNGDDNNDDNNNPKTCPQQTNQDKNTSIGRVIF